jgi:hypothetical protein
MPLSRQHLKPRHKSPAPRVGIEIYSPSIDGFAAPRVYAQITCAQGNQALSEDLQHNIANYRNQLPLRDPGVSIR